MSRRSKLDASRLRELLDYNPETGTFTWKVHRGGRARAGTVAGAIDSSGHRQIAIDSRTYQANRLAWLHQTGSWPRRLVDHEDLDPSNDRWSNLREATKSQNKTNSTVRSDNRLGVKGVSIVPKSKKNRYRAMIKVNGRRLHLGCFATLGEAGAAYSAAARIHFGEFSRA